MSLLFTKAAPLPSRRRDRVLWATVLAVTGALLVATPALAKDGPPTLHYRPSAEAAEERPLPVDVWVTPEGTDLALHVLFNRAPFGEECQNRCASSTLYLDTDISKETGLQLGKDAAETGADLAVTIQGLREYTDDVARTRLRVKVRLLGNGAHSVDDGELLAELDLHHDPERVQTKGPHLWLRLETTNPGIPSAHKMRVVFHPPGERAVEALGPGLIAGGSRRVDIYRRGKKSKN